MKTFNIQISEDQMKLIRASLLHTLMNEKKLTENEEEEMEILADMILDVVEEGDEEVTHGFCY